ncbi:molecular chaperone [Enterobacter bugandensis]|uniref:fimbrial biogenesis chaperone n=1 Tax=Enterobacter bugandensis TaxID=881260 RepID=UPI0023AF7AA9|nr:molecular chaperone [Enterobacter bugandensis]MDE7590858.1 molecular chaperone [Enterobacter bugandensis]
MTLFKKLLISTVAIVSMTSFSYAGVTIGGTRVIFDGAKKEASLTVNNQDEVPYLIQSWVEKSDQASEKPPFVITPPLYRLDKGQKNIQRIIQAGNLAQDKESLYWINVKSIPASEAKDNVLQIAIKTRIKLIYRPESLSKGTPEQFTDSLSWKRNGNEIVVTNHSPYVMNFSEISVDGKAIKDVNYVLPGATKHFTATSSAAGTVSYKLINDYGALSKEIQAKI